MNDSVAPLTTPARYCNAGSSNKRTPWRHFVLSVALGVSLFGCVGSSHLMADAPASAAPIAPSAGVASVVFARPSSFGWAVNFTIVDHNGRFIGDAVANSHFAVQVPPGEYFFIADGENTEVVHATLAPGKVYYVEVAARMGILTARVSIEPLRRDTDAWRAIVGSLAATRRLVPLSSTGQAEIDRNAKAVQRRVERAKQRWAELSPAERAARTLAPDDGTGDTHSGPPVPSSAPATPQPTTAPQGAPATPPVARPAAGV